MIIGTRGSALALAQANLVSSMLAERGVETTIKIIKTNTNIWNMIKKQAERVPDSNVPSKSANVIRK